MRYCNFCERITGRPVHENNAISYMNGDRTETLGNSGRKKVYWKGIEYDNMPYTFNIQIPMVKDQTPLDIPVS